MPNIKSAKKRVSVIARRKEENRYVKSTMSTMIKNFRAVVTNDPVKAESMLKDIISYIDSAKSKGVIHHNTASRKISRLHLMLNKSKKLNKKEEVQEEVVEEKKEVEEKPANTEKKPRATKKASKKEE